jgi:uncharacterized protein
MIDSFLNSLWREGALMGARPADAFAVLCGLNETMTAEDVLGGIMRVTLLVALTKPAEFTAITFQQMMQKS